MKIYEDKQVVGEIDLGKDIRIDTKNSGLIKILEYAVSSPLPLYSGYEKDGVFVTTITDVCVGDKGYQDAIKEFLAGYGYYLI